MQLLIVHHDAEVGEELVRMIREYTEHQAGFANSDAGALDWARGVTRCSLLITQLQAEGVNGFALAANLCEMFAGMQTMFLPDYSVSDQRLEIAESKVFPEPIDGERVLDAIAIAEEHRQTGQDLFHALDILQMCCLAGRSGALQLVNGSKTALVYLLNGEIVHAERGTARGVDALYELVPWEAVEFAYDYAQRATVQSINLPWDEAVVAAVGRRKGQPVGSTSPSETAPPAKTKRTFFGLRK
ncbi:MAG: DUF4388 domain-containing protein [Verrucomicrobiota bacterium]|nr:DUF4388 domain-containing protein [Verrucomicrobiota bacterium]MDQ6938764.1 DUF4388 domain-containing protein [Verrucomicrobiota bacterium]